MQTILVLGSWSSGTTAVTGYIHRIGAYSCPPHFITNDPRTPDSHESIELRNILIRCINESTLKPQVHEHSKIFKEFLRVWIPAKQAEAKANGYQALVLKHPLTAFFIIEFVEICNPMCLVVTRGFQDIENTRIRRRWPTQFGQQGANVIYGTIFGALMHCEKSFYTVSFREFLRSSDDRKNLRKYLNVAMDEKGIESAESWLRRG
jgi:hypothetical protein